MPQVASETNAHLINHAYRPARPDRAPGDTPASAFETMLDETARAASDQSRTSPSGDRASTERPETNRPPAESEPSKAAKADDAGHAEPETADAGPPAGKPADSKSADGQAGETDRGGTNDPIVLTDASAEADAVEQVDVAASADSSGEAETDGEDAEAGEEAAKTTRKQAKPDPGVIADGKPADGSEPNDGDTETAASAGPKTTPAVAPTPTAAALHRARWPRRYPRLGTSAMNAINTTPIPASSAASVASGTVDKVTIASNFNTFLQLLTTQLKNQNPLDPLDTNQFTQQLVQFAQVEQQMKSHDQLAALVSLEKSAQATTALAYVGSTVVVDVSTARLSGGQASCTHESRSPPPSSSRTTPPARPTSAGPSRSIPEFTASPGTGTAMMARYGLPAATR